MRPAIRAGRWSWSRSDVPHYYDLRNLDESTPFLSQHDVTTGPVTIINTFIALYQKVAVEGICEGE